MHAIQDPESTVVRPLSVLPQHSACLIQCDSCLRKDSVLRPGTIGNTRLCTTPPTEPGKRTTWTRCWWTQERIRLITRTRGTEPLSRSPSARETLPSLTVYFLPALSWKCWKGLDTALAIGRNFLPPFACAFEGKSRGPRYTQHRCFSISRTDAEKYP